MKQDYDTIDKNESFRICQNCKKILCVAKFPEKNIDETFSNVSFIWIHSLYSG